MRKSSRGNKEKKFLLFCYKAIFIAIPSWFSFHCIFFHQLHSSLSSVSHANFFITIIHFASNVGNIFGKEIKFCDDVKKIYNYFLYSFSPVHISIIKHLHFLSYFQSLGNKNNLSWRSIFNILYFFQIEEHWEKNSREKQHFKKATIQDCRSGRKEIKYKT